MPAPEPKSLEFDFGIGNDVVDLLDAESRPESFRPRFDARVFDAAEQSAIERDARSLATRWAHWGAKEAAYKLIRQHDSSFVFSPSRLVANFEPARARSDREFERSGRLHYEARGHRESGLVLDLYSLESAEWVHVLALPTGHGMDLDSIHFGIVALSPQDASNASLGVRRFALQEIARRWEVDVARLSIGRRPSGESGLDDLGAAGTSPVEAGDGHPLPGATRRIPTIELDGVAMPNSLSLSHHGRWVGFAMTSSPGAIIPAHPSRGRAMGACA